MAISEYYSKIKQHYIKNGLVKSPQYCKENGFLSLALMGVSHTVEPAHEWIFSKFLSHIFLSKEEMKSRYNYHQLPKEDEFTINSETSKINQIGTLNQYNGDYRPSIRTVYEVPHGTVAGYKPIAFTEKNEFIPMYTDELLYSIRCRPMGGGSILNFYKTLFNSYNDLPTYEQLFILTHHGDHNYHNWVRWFLPQLRTLRYYEKKKGTKPKILVQNNPPSYMLDSLEYFGVNLNRCEEWDRTSVCAKNLIVPNLRVQNSFRYDISIEDCNWLKNKGGKKLEESSLLEEAGSDRIYVSRQLAETRSVENFIEVSQILEKYGFKSYNLEQLSFQQQVQLFSQANCIVGPHGAGLVNMVFAPEDSSVIELMPDKRVNAHFYLLAKTNNHDYNIVMTEYNDDENIMVNVSKLDSILSEALTERSETA
jgi:hypothetical protein